MSDEVLTALGDIQRTLGKIDGKLESHLDAFKAHCADDTAALGAISGRLDRLTASEIKRQGERATWAKILGGATAVAGAWEAVKAFWHHS